MREIMLNTEIHKFETCAEFAEIQAEAFAALESEALKSFEHVPGMR